METPLGPEYVPYTYMDPLGKGSCGPGLLDTGRSTRPHLKCVVYVQKGPNSFGRSTLGVGISRVETRISSFLAKGCPWKNRSRLSPVDASFLNLKRRH